MLKKTITYEDYNGVERTEDYHFNLTKAEIMEMEMGTAGGLAEKLQKIVDAKEAPEIIKTFKEIILKAYGVKSDDGRFFRKVDDQGNPVSIAFSQTEAYSQLFMELATDADAASKFINGIVPKDMSQQQPTPIPFNK